MPTPVVMVMIRRRLAAARQHGPQPNPDKAITATVGPDPSRATTASEDSIPNPSNAITAED